jgi:hypothetical protein
MASDILADYKSRKDLIDKYDNNSLLLYVLELYTNTDDIDNIASNSLTDNADDKKCDLLHIDKDMRIAIIAQGYISEDETKKEAKSNKAADLNTAATWLLKQDYSDLPETLMSAGKELIDALNNREISKIEFWYVHNLPESHNVENELKKVSDTAHALISKNFPEAGIETILSKEYGTNNIDELYRSTRVAMKIDKDFEMEIEDGFVLNTEKYKVFTTAINGAWLKEKYDEYKEKMFSANIRDYFGSRNSQENINNKIKETASNNEDDFFAYNNGITIIVNRLNTDEYKEKHKINFNGLAIVNGAQTTGAISLSGSKNFSKIKVLTRFVQYVDKSIVNNIIRYNNTQNYIEISDFRSNDIIQKRLRDEFSSISGFGYTGARRGGAEDKIIRDKNSIPTDTAAQAIAAFHGEPGLAYNDKRNIWSNDKIYSRFFNESLNALHIIFCYSLLKSIENFKTTLKMKSETERTEIETKILTSLRKKGSVFILVSAVANCMEIFLTKSIRNKFSIQFSKIENLDAALDIWKPVIDSVISFIHKLDKSLDNSLKNAGIVKNDINEFASMVNAINTVNRSIFDSFAKKLLVND